MKALKSIQKKLSESLREKFIEEMIGIITYLKLSDIFYEFYFDGIRYQMFIGKFTLVEFNDDNMSIFFKAFVKKKGNFYKLMNEDCNLDYMKSVLRLKEMIQEGEICKNN